MGNFHIYTFGANKDPLTFESGLNKVVSTQKVNDTNTSGQDRMAYRRGGLIRQVSL